MKRVLSIIVTSLLIMSCISGCSPSATAAPASTATAAASSKSPDTKKLKIVATIFPEYDWVKNVLGDKAENAELTLLLDKGTDLHSFQPTAADILKISSCDLFIYVGGESDKWVDGALKEAVNKNMVVINLMQALGDAVKEEELVEGMQGEEEEKEYDEHVWLSLKNAATCVGKISEALQKLDAANADKYKTNAASYTDKLNSLDKDYAKAVEDGKQKTLLFGDRFPFRYMTEDYKLKYYAAFIGCSAETEASFETISFLAKKADELSLNSILTIEGSDKKIAETINSNTGRKNLKILTLDSLQSTTSENVKNGASYLSAMEKNLEILKEALQ